MKILKKILAFLIVNVLFISGIKFVSAENVVFEKRLSINIDGNAYLTCTSDKYLFVLVGESAELAYEIKVYDKENFAYLTSITTQHPDTVYLNVNAMHVKGDYLYATFIQRKGGNPLAAKYNIKEIYENKVVLPEITTGMRPKAYSYIDDNIVCRTDSGYRNITFMDLETLSDKSAIGISEQNAELLGNYTKIYIKNNLLFAVYNKSIHMYDASFALSGTSKQDEIVYIGNISPGWTAVNDLKATDNYLYCATTEGIYIYDIQNPSAPVKHGTISRTYNAKNIVINNEYMYVAKGNTLELFDISDKKEPKSVGTINETKEITSIHLRPGKIYLGQNMQISVYDATNLTIAETTVCGSKEEAGEIIFNKEVAFGGKADDICTFKDYLFILNEEKDEISVYDKKSETVVDIISREVNGMKLPINNMYVSEGYLYVSYDSIFRKYLISESGRDDFLEESMAVPMFSEENDVSNAVCETDKYIFVATGNNKDRSLLANGKILVYEKDSKEYLTSISIDTGNTNYDMAVRNMWATGDNLYVSYNNAKTATNYTSSLSGVMPDWSRAHAPLCRYDVANVEKNQLLSPCVITSNTELQNLSHPYNRGGNSYYSKAEKIIYQGIYTEDNGQCYRGYNALSDNASLEITLKNGSYDCVKFTAENGCLLEILQNNGALTTDGTTQEYNKVLVYDISDSENGEIDLSQRKVGVYQTEIYGNTVINDALICGNSLYAATTNGVEKVNLTTFKKESLLLDGLNVYSLETANNMLFASTQSGVHIIDVRNSEIISEKILNTEIYDICVNENEGNVYITYKKNEGYGLVLSYFSEEKAKLKENLPVLNNVDKTNPALYRTSWSANAGQMVLENDKYIFVALSEKSFASCGVVQIFDKLSGELITTLSEETSDNNRYRPIRNMHLYDDVLIVTWGNGWTLGDVNCYVYDGVMSPVKAYDVSNVTSDLIGKTIFTGGQRTSGHAPYILGNISYLDEENGLLYISEIMRKDYGLRYYYVYDVKEIKSGLKTNDLSDLSRKRFQTSDLSLNTVKFVVKDGYLYEVLLNKAGFTDYNCTSTLADSSGNTLNNMIRIYDLRNVTLTDASQSVSNHIVSTYTTSISGDSVIKDIEVFGGFLYVATTEGVEVVELNGKETLECVKTLKGAGCATDVEICQNNLYVSFAGPQFYETTSSSTNGSIALYELNGSDMCLKTEQSVKYGVCNFTVDSENYEIYILGDVYNPPYLTGYNYSEKATMFGGEKTIGINNVDSLFLETQKSYKTSKSNKYTLVLSGETEETADKILVFNSSDSKAAEIALNGTVMSDFYVGENYFYTFDKTQLSIYKIPSANSVISDCLIGRYDAGSDINSLVEADNKLYVATLSGMYIYDISSVSESSITKLNFGVDGEVYTIVQNGEYICGAKEDGVFLFDTNNYTQDAFCDFTEGIITDITAYETDIFASCDDGKVMCFVANDDVIVDYNVAVFEPKEKVRSDINIGKGFPSISYKERVYSNHNKIAANDKYVITAGINEIKIYDDSLTEIDTLSCTNVTEIYLNGNILTVADNLGGLKITVYDLDSSDSREITMLSGNGYVFTDESGIWVWDKTMYEITNFSYDGDIKRKITDCPQELTKIYFKDGFLYLVNGKNIKLYGAVSESLQQSANQLYKGYFDTVQKVTALEAVDDYLYISTYGGNAPSNMLYIYNLGECKNGLNENPTQHSSYSTMRSEQGGGRITDFERCGDFLIADAVDAGEIQIINIKERERLYLESYIKKGENDSYHFSDIDIGKDKVFAIAQNGGLCVYDYKTVDISDISFISDGKESYVPQGEKLSAKVSIYNESASVFNGKLILALYGGENKNELENLILTDVMVQNGEAKEILTEEIKLGSSGEYIIKAMLFDELTSLRPLCEVARNFDAIDETVIYVDAMAELGGNGTKDAPFKTIEEAKEEIRKINKAMTGDITVEIAGGRYELTKPLIFDKADSGYNGYNVIYKAKDGEKPVISGGKVIDGWTLYDEEKGIYCAPSDGINSRQLYVNGKRAQRARSKGGLTDAKTDGGLLGIYCYNEEIAEYENIKDLEFVFIDSFLSKRIGADGAYKMDSEGKTLITLNRPFWQYPTGFKEYILPSYYENALELLDEENEFYIDTKKGIIYYKPIEGEDINSSFVVAPVLEKLVEISGMDLYNRARNIHFEGLEFTDTTWMGATADGGFSPHQAGQFVLPLKDKTYYQSNLTENAITIKKAENIVISGCIIKNLGGNVMRVTKSKDITIIGNKIYDVAAGGIYVGEIEKSEADPKDERKIVKNINISNNYMKDIACEYYSSVAIATGTVQDTQITHNEIINTSYSAIHLGWGWDTLPKRNIIGLEVSHNHIVNSVTVLGDGGAIYTTGYTMGDSNSNPNLITENYIEKVNGNSVFAGSAIYLDTGSSGYLVSKNVIDLTQSEGAWIPKWSTGNNTNIFDGNYSTTANGEAVAINTTVSIKAEWNKEASAICENAGLLEEYSYLAD